MHVLHCTTLCLLSCNWDSLSRSQSTRPGLPWLALSRADTRVLLLCAACCTLRCAAAARQAGGQTPPRIAARPSPSPLPWSPSSGPQSRDEEWNPGSAALLSLWLRIASQRSERNAARAAWAQQPEAKQSQGLITQSAHANQAASGGCLSSSSGGGRETAAESSIDTPSSVHSAAAGRGRVRRADFVLARGYGLLCSSDCSGRSAIARRRAPLISYPPRAELQTDSSLWRRDGPPPPRWLSLLPSTGGELRATTPELLPAGGALWACLVARAMSPGGGESQHLLLAEVGYEAVRCKTERLLRPERRRRRPWTALDGQERPAPKANPATYAALNGKPPARPSRGGAQIQAVLGALQLSDTWLRGPPVNASGWVV
ncbi:hypothetical protein Purlil1_5686 [Purpureocillium lilacinum]|uniref:Uncharacterized protein n=1 Tax=Purpureocillium lilacinum TaxID=33203 RepID=A0ABR0C1H7_PURLI|nr:hypothetical protein Purlil1_5686 [Purpureocillium lilacinum]